MSINKTSNSFATVLAEFIRLQNNSLEQLQKVSQAVNTNSESISINQKNTDGTESNFSIPSFGYLKSNIDRIDKTITNLLGFDGSDANVRMPDGTFKKIYQSKNVKEPLAIGNILQPSKFVADNNWFFENLSSPSLKVPIDVSQYVPQEESKIFAKRLILNIDNDTKLEYFNNEINNKNNLEYVKFLINLQKNNISYFVDEEIIDLPLSIVRFTGDFTVINIEDRKINNSDGSTSTKRWYLFDSNKYNDNLSLSKQTMVLQIGDKLIKGETIYEVADIDKSTNHVKVKRLSGYEPFIIGGKVSFYSEKFSPKIAKVGIGFNEYTAIFLKSINDETNIISSSFSPGVAFYSNNLNIDLVTGQKDLKTFYNESVLDFGSMLISSAKEKQIQAVDGLPPNPPVLNVDNFKVILINDHKLNQEEIVSIRKKQADKIRLSSEITELEKTIDRKKEELNTTKFNSETERRAVKNQLETIIKEKDTKTALYTSIVKELAVTAQQKPASLDTPKYRIRGFFPIPEPVFDETGRPQNVIQFYIYYRYVRPDGSASDIKQFDYSDSQGVIKRGTYSNLNELKTEIRKKQYDPLKGSYIWLNENIEDPNLVNINQVDIPISKGEKVEFYVVSVSEAGWPINPILSEPSNTISIVFPVDLVTEDEASIALKEALQDSVRIDLQSDIASKGLDIHLQSSFSSAERYFAHDSNVIASSFFTPEGNPISLYEKLAEMSLRIVDLENRLNKVVGAVKVYILDEEKNTKLPVKSGDVITLFAGYYADDVDKLPTQSRRGAIITKAYKLILENEEASPIQLVSRLPGGITDNLPDSTVLPEQGGTYDIDYRSYRRYERVPINNPSINPEDTNNANKFSSSFYQSGQVKGQYVYSRYTNIGLVNNLYYNEDDFAEDRAILPIISDTDPLLQQKEWIWDGADVNPGNLPAGNGLLTEFSIHIDHPAIIPKLDDPVVNLVNMQTPEILIDNATGNPNSPEKISKFRHSYGFNHLGDKNNPAKQLEYRHNWITQPPGIYPAPLVPTIEELPDKYGFTDNDRYLIGSNTCGSYFYLGPVTYNQLLVNGVDARASTSLQPGGNNAIIIPIIFQYRMTDYFGPPIVNSTSPGDYGILGGFNRNVPIPPANLTYVRRIGLDVYQQDMQVFSFDVQIAATYKKDSLIQLYETGVPSSSKELKAVTYDKATIKTIFS